MGGGHDKRAADTEDPRRPLGYGTTPARESPYGFYVAEKARAIPQAFFDSSCRPLVGWTCGGARYKFLVRNGLPLVGDDTRIGRS